MVVAGALAFGTDRISEASQARDAAVFALASAKPENSLDLADLSAQARMAAAAEDMSRWTLFQILLSAITIVGLGWTINQTNRSLTLASETARAELQPYLGIEGAEVVSMTPGHKLEFNWTVRNFGTTPAVDVKIRSQWRHVASAPANAILAPSLNQKTQIKGYDVPPGGVIRLWSNTNGALSAAQIHAIEQGQAYVVVNVEVCFKGPFKEQLYYRAAQARWGKDLNRSRMAQA